MSKRRVVVMPGEFDAAAAVDAVRNIGGSGDVRIDRAVWYPYFSFDASCRVPTFGGRRAVTVPCLVDAINGVAMTCDRFHAAEVQLESSALLAARVEYEAAANAARKIVLHQLGKRARMIANFHIDLDRPQLMYRRFWIVTVGERLSLVDSVSGAVQAMQVTAA